MNVDPFTTWDASYANSGLSDPERAEMDVHLATCLDCTARVAVAHRLAGLIRLVPDWALDDQAPQTVGRGALSSVSPAGVREFGTFDAEPATRESPEFEVPGTLLLRLSKQIHRERRRRRLVSLTGALAAAAAVVGLIAVTSTDRRSGIPDLAPVQASALSAVVASPISAEAQVVTTDTWARVDFWATCSTTNRPGGTYRLIALSTDGKRVELGTWPAIPGQTAVLRVPTQIHTIDLAALEIVSASGQAVSRLAVTT